MAAALGDVSVRLAKEALGTRMPPWSGWTRIRHQPSYLFGIVVRRRNRVIILREPHRKAISLVSIVSPTAADLRRRYRACPISCPMFSSRTIESLSDFFAVFHSLLRGDKTYWFRGHSSLSYNLVPSALRFSSADKRDAALQLVSELPRYLDMKLARPPERDDDLGWMQVAQHYGLPTRLLDWTQNAAVALFFACHNRLDKDGLVAILNPVELNQHRDPRAIGIYNPRRDRDVIAPYFRLDGRIRARGRHTIAINPTWNTERIAQQHGAFTLHGSRNFALDSKQASSLIYVPILHDHKESLLNELERVGIGEMFIFPEPEHVCSHLLRNARL